MGSSSPRVRAAAILILLFIKTVANRADSECQQEWLEKGIAWRYFFFSLSVSASLFTLNAFYSLCLSLCSHHHCRSSVCLSLCLYLPSAYSILNGWVILNQINKELWRSDKHSCYETEVHKRWCLLWEILCRPAMDFSDKLISNAIKWTACCRTGIIYSRLKLIKFLLQKLPLSLFMSHVFHFSSFMWIPEVFRWFMNYCMPSVVYVSNSGLKGG